MVDAGNRFALPLGANAIRKDLGLAVMQEVTTYLKRSIEYGVEHRDEAWLTPCSTAGS
ncbi:MAG: hypothetical protein Ct9H300mP1_12410 [Planctomycetaceae bacterium]|nr:MAG: hypothetical protein Ct9H300mP1_12410 [Planctomycetaceae bacterium]